MTDLWTLDELAAIERRYPTREIAALVAEIRRLNVIAMRAADVIRQLEAVPEIRNNLPSTLQMTLAALKESCLLERARGNRGINL